MGKKAKAKKIRREEKQEQQATKQAKKPFLEKILGKGRKSSKAALAAKNVQMYSWLLSFIMLAILLFLGYLLFQKSFRPQPLAALLPEKNTVTFAEISTNFQHTQLQRSFKLLSKHPEYSQEKFIAKLEEITGLSYATQIEPWLGRQAGVAILNYPEENGVHTFYFFEYLSRKSLEEILTNKSAVLSTAPAVTLPKKYPAFFIGGKHYISIVGDYAVFTGDGTALRSFIDSQSGSRLFDSKKYSRIDDNLPLIHTAFFYVDFDNISDSVFQKFSVLGESGFSLDLLRPFLKFFDAEGTAIVALDDNFALHSFLGFDAEFFKGADFFGRRENYQAGLTRYIGADTRIFWGGQNLSAQIKRLTGIISGGNKGTAQVFDSLLNNYAQKYFGQETVFQDDILPLLQKEFAFSFEKKTEENTYRFLFELADRENDKLKLHELANSFASVGAFFEPKVVERVLPDGTVGKEIVAIPEEITKNEIAYGNATIYELQLGKEGKGIYYSLPGGIAIIANSLESVKETLGLIEDSSGSLGNSPAFARQIQPLLRDSDEILYFAGGIGPISAFSSGHDYFDDGIATTSYINIK